MLKNKLIDDTILKATQGAPSDDSEISREQIAYWATEVRHQLIKNEVDIELRAGRGVPPVYISREDCEALAIEDLECQGECVDGLYVDLTTEIVDLEGDGGFIRAVTDEGDQVKIIHIGMLDTIRSLRFSKPSMENPICYRVGTRIYVEGFSASEAPFNFITIYYVKKQNVQALAETDEVICSSLIAPLLIDRLSEMLKDQMYGSSPDTDGNNGIDVKNLAYHRLVKANPNQTPEQPA